MNIMVLGLRGFPDIQGGVEAHAEKLYPLLARRGCAVEVLVRSPYWPTNRSNEWEGVRFRRLWAPHATGIEAFLHSLLGVFYAGLKRPDVLHIHAIGPAIVTPIARFLGLRVVVTHHGPDYDREKWSSFARWILRMGESLGMRFANQRIVISKVIANLVKDKYRLDSRLIPNGVAVPPLPESTGSLQEHGLTPGRYVLCVSRFVPEKRQIDLIKAFAMARLEDWKLVLVGAIDVPDDYIAQVRELAKNTPGVVLTGFQSGLALRELYGHAGIFVLPSSHEGLPIALLEALSYGLPALASDIAANLEIGLQDEQYFPLGDISSLAKSLSCLGQATIDTAEREKRREWVRKKYDWESIADATLVAYKDATEHQPPPASMSH